MLTMDRPLTLRTDNYGPCQNEWCGRIAPRDTYGLCADHPTHVTTSTRGDAVGELKRIYTGLRDNPTTPKTAPPMVITHHEHTTARWMLNSLTDWDRERLMRRTPVWPQNDPMWTVRWDSRNYPTYRASVALAVARGEYTIRKDTPSGR